MPENKAFIRLLNRLIHEIGELLHEIWILLLEMARGMSKGLLEKDRRLWKLPGKECPPVVPFKLS